MNIRVPSELVELAEIFNKNGSKLYIVGGFIRNQILGIPDSYNTDIDICSSTCPGDIVKMLENSSFAVNYLNEELGVVEIKRNLRVEHATFRKEKYNLAGVHIPNNIEFIKDLKTDAKRRDFRCNAIYYDILGQEIVDPLDGVIDTEKRILRTTLSPEEVFKNDAERILRMVRLASTLAFNVEPKTYEAAKLNAYKLQYISSTRKREEFSQIVLADTKYDFLSDIKRAHARGVNMLADLDALKYILPALDAIKDSNIIEDRGKFLFEHVMNVFALSAPEVRLSALLHDAGKAKTFLDYRSFNGSSEFSDIIIEKNLGQEGLCFPKKIVERVKRVVRGLDFNKSGLETPNSIKKFIVDNNEDIWLIVALKNAVEQDKSRLKHKIAYSAYKLQKMQDKMKKQEAPMTVGDLKIKGDKLLEMYPSLKENTVGVLLKEMLYKCAFKPSLNTFENLSELSRKIIVRKKSFYLE